MRVYNIIKSRDTILPSSNENNGPFGAVVFIGGWNLVTTYFCPYEENTTERGGQ